MKSCSLFILMMLCSSLFGALNELANPGLLPGANGIPDGWTCVYGNIPRQDTAELRNQKTATYVERRKGQANFGLVQEINYSQPDTKPILFGGWSKAAGVVGESGYNIYIDLYFADGTNAWAVKAYWTAGTHDWQHTFSCYRPAKPVAKLKYYIFLRGESHGQVWFDDFELYRGEPDVQIGSVMMQSAEPFSPNSLFLTANFFRPVSYRCALLDAAGKELLGHQGRGGEIRWFAEPAGTPAKWVIDASADHVSGHYEYPIDVVAARPNNPVKNGFRLWTADSMTNVSPATYPSANAANTLMVELAKAEFESGQILLTAGPRPLTNVTVTLPILKDACGNQFAGKMKWERVGYVPRRKPYAYHPHGYAREEFWLPDPLLPARDFAVPANATQGIWLTIQADRDARAGVYQGDVIVSVDGKAETVSLSVRVFDFALPKTFSLQTAFCIMDGWLFKAYPERAPDALRRQAWDIMLDHRLNPDDITRTELPSIKDLLYARERGMNRFNIMNLVPKPEGNPLWVCHAEASEYTDETFEEFKRRLDPYIAELRKNGLARYAYLYGFDEREDRYYPIIAKLHKMLQARYPEVPLLTTSRMYRSLKADPRRTDCYANDWFCPSTGEYDDALSAKLRAKGHQVWWYVCCSPKYPYANFAGIEYPFIEGRLLSWMTYQHHVDGLLYWHVNAWHGPYRFDETSCYQPGFKLNSVDEMVGDGQLMYPGANGPLPSIRLANVRDGSEDFDYLTLSGESGRFRCDELVTDMKNYTRDAEKLRKVRRSIAEYLEKQP